MFHYTEPKYIKMADEVVEWFNSLIDKSSTMEELYRNFFIDLPAFSGKSITKKAMAINITTRNVPWNFKTTRNEVLDQFKLVRKIVSCGKPYYLYYIDIYANDITYILDQKTGYMKCYAYHCSEPPDDIKERFKTDGLLLDDNGNCTKIKNKKKV